MEHPPLFRKLKKNLGPIQQETQYQYNSPSSPSQIQTTHRISTNCSTPIFHPQQSPDQIYKIKNLDTGEQIDIRDQNKQTFASKIAKVLNLQKQKIQLKEYYKLKRQMNDRLWESIQRNDIQEIIRLLDKSQYGNLVAQTNAKGLNDWTALHVAAVDGFTEAVITLIREGESTDINAKTSINRTPLHLACLHGFIEVAKVLVEYGADINAVDDDHNTSLHYACMHGHTQIVQWLLDKNPEINFKNCISKTCLDVCANVKIYNLIAEYCQKYNLGIPKSPYSRTPFYRSILHNSRSDVVNKILLKGLYAPSSRDLQTFNDRPKKVQMSQELRYKEESIFLPPTKVGPQDFKGLLQLGKGSFGQVYLVEKIDTREFFALKVLKKDKVFGNNLVRYAFTQRNILMNIDHPFIVKLNYSFQTPENLVLVMDFCPNGDLGMHLARQKKFSEEKARFYTAQVLLALEDLHKHGIIFRDLKPENVVLDQKGHAKLTDFGLSKEGVYENQFASSFCGSMAYLAPEMLKRSGHTRSVDWYLLGVLLYQMLVGSPPYYSTDRERLFNNILKGKLRVPNFVSEPAKNFIIALLNRKPNQRLGTSKRDSEQLKQCQFFKSIDWQALLRKEVQPPYVKPIRRGIKDIPLNKMFGTPKAQAGPTQLDGWSFVQELKK